MFVKTKVLNKKILFLLLLFCLAFFNGVNNQKVEAGIKGKGNFEKVGESKISGVHKAISLKDGRVLLMGFAASKFDMQAQKMVREYISEIYNPKDRSITKAHAGSRLGSPVLGHDGKVLIFGPKIELYDPDKDITVVLNDTLIDNFEHYSNPLFVDQNHVYFMGASYRQSAEIVYLYERLTNNLTYYVPPEELGYLIYDNPSLIPVEDAFVITGVSEKNQTVMLHEHYAHEGADSSILNANEYIVTLAPFPQNSLVIPLDKQHILYGDYLTSRINLAEWSFNQLRMKSNFTDHANYALLPNGNAFLLGGKEKKTASCIDGLSRNTEFFLQKTQEFIKGPEMLQPRRDAQITILKNGDLLISGGYIERCKFPYLVPTHDLEIYHIN